MERHLRHKFACEIFIGRAGFPPDVDFLPNNDVVEAWKVLYLPKTLEELGPWYLAHLQRRSKLWKDIECTSFHIPRGEHLSVNRS